LAPSLEHFAKIPMCCHLATLSHFFLPLLSHCTLWFSPTPCKSSICILFSSASTHNHVGETVYLWKMILFCHQKTTPLPKCLFSCTPWKQKQERVSRFSSFQNILCHSYTAGIKAGADQSTPAERSCPASCLLPGAASHQSCVSHLSPVCCSFSMLSRDPLLTKLSWQLETKPASTSLSSSYN
jgi:hypothetical protein